MNRAASIPVLLVIFNRPELTRRALEALLAAQPDVLMVAADGPRNDAERALCTRTRDVVASARIDCPLLTDYAETNMGCGVRVRSAVDWALSEYESVIVLEDDCIAAPDFFRFCRELLTHYSDDERVMHIAGNNFQPQQPGQPGQPGQADSGPSYYFSKYSHGSSWATWRRAWQHNDWQLRRWPQLKATRWLQQWCDDPLEREYWTKIFDEVSVGADDIWDYQWMFSCWANNALSVVPRVNLVSNVGVGADATHTRETNRFLELPVGRLPDIEHPARIERNAQADRYTFDHNFGGAEMRFQRSVRMRIRRRFPWLAPPVRLARRLLSRRRPGVD